MPGARARHRATPPASLLAWRPPRRSGRSRASPRHPDPSCTLPRPPSLPLLSLSHPKHCRRRSSPPTRSPPSLRPSVESTSSATTPSTSSSSHEPPDALCSRRRHRLPPRTPSTADSNSPSPTRPRPQRAALEVRGELRHRSPLFSPSFPRRNSVPHHGRTSAVAELAVDAAPVTIWSPRRVQRVHRTP